MEYHIFYDYGYEITGLLSFKTINGRENAMRRLKYRHPDGIFVLIDGTIDKNKSHNLGEIEECYELSKPIDKYSKK